MINFRPSVESRARGGAEGGAQGEEGGGTGGGRRGRRRGRQWWDGEEEEVESFAASGEEG